MVADDVPGLVVGGFYGDFLLRDERQGRTWLVLSGLEDERPRAFEERFDGVVEQLRASPASTPFASTGALERRTPPGVHRARVDEARDWIAAGEIYQANLAHAFERDVRGEPVDLYRRLRAASPTPYAGFLRVDEAAGSPRFALASCSPELLLEVRPQAPPSGARARTRPIKGTVRRPADPVAEAAADERARDALLASAKDRAELAMIVDLARNDLGRVARRGGVHVRRFPELESHAAVHHLVADVVATLGRDVHALDALAALFPGGSITGAPKLRSMEAIAAIEGEPRGFAFGSLGLADLRGAACFNILIRTVEWRPRRAVTAAASAEASATPDAIPGRVRLRVGGGITWRSDPAAEDDETLAKASALLAALEGE